MIKKGATFIFNTKVIDFNIKDNKIISVITKKVNENSSNIEEIKSNFVILAIEHSSKDTF